MVSLFSVSVDRTCPTRSNISRIEETPDRSHMACLLLTSHHALEIPHCHRSHRPWALLARSGRVAIVQARWDHGRAEFMSRPTRGVLTIWIILAMLSPSFAQDAPVFRAGIDLVNLDVTVVDRNGNMVSGLNANEFAVAEDGQPQTVRYFVAGKAVDRHLHLGLLLDVSDSMSEPLRFTKTAVIKFFTSVVDAVDITLVDFDTQVRATRYDRGQYIRLIERIRQQKAGGATALYDAIGVYLSDAADQEGRKVMLLYTDGGDNQSSMDFSDLIDVLKASDVTVYVIGRIAPQVTTSRGGVVIQLARIAEITGGEAFFPQSAEDLASAYQTILSQISGGYTIGYVPTNDRADGTWRHIEVKAIGRDGHAYRVRGRNGYYAPYKTAAKPCGTAPEAGRAATTVPNC
jgi:Ca-activated chloride channel family protein